MTASFLRTSLLKISLAGVLIGLTAAGGVADQQDAAAALNAPTVDIGGNSDLEWGPIVSQGTMRLQGAWAVHFPQKFAGGKITMTGGSAGNTIHCQNGPESDGKEFFCGLNPAPDYPRINFADYRALAQLEGNACGGQPCL